MKRELNLLISLSLSAAMLTSCGENKPDNTEVAGNTPAQTTTETATSTDEEDSDDSDTTDQDFFSLQLEENSPKEIDIDSDGQMDEITFESNYLEDEDKYYYDIQIKDQTISVVDENTDSDIEFADAYYSQAEDGNYVIASLSGICCTYQTILYRWEDGELKEIDSLDGYKVYEFTDNNLLLGEVVDVFGTWITSNQFYYDKTGLWTAEKHPKITNPTGLELKQDITFYDESGEEPKSAKAGDKIYPCILGQNCIGFSDENDEFLGYLIYSSKEEDGIEVFYVDGVSEYDLFTNVAYAS